MKKNDELNLYLNVIRKTVISNSFLLQYFLKIVVVYMISNGVTTCLRIFSNTVS